VTSSLLDTLLAEYIPLYSYNAMLERWSWNAICVRRVKLRLLYSLVAAEMANSSANQWNIGLDSSSLIVKIARTPALPDIVVTTFGVLRRYGIPLSMLRRGMIVGGRIVTRYPSHSGSSVQSVMALLMCIR
jgi:hypothetical protein